MANLITQRELTELFKDHQNHISEALRDLPPKGKDGRTLKYDACEAMAAMYDWYWGKRCYYVTVAKGFNMKAMLAKDEIRRMRKAEEADAG